LTEKVLDTNQRRRNAFEVQYIGVVTQPGEKAYKGFQGATPIPAFMPRRASATQDHMDVCCDNNRKAPSRFTLPAEPGFFVRPAMNA
jgi:hypothetical protein